MSGNPSRYVIRATISGVADILCPRPYPRPDHCDAFTYASQGEAQAAADKLAKRFPGNSYQVQTA